MPPTCTKLADSMTISNIYDVCTNCTDVWFGVPFFLFLEFAPITVLYLIILMFQVRLTSAPMTCFIMYAQFIVTS